MNNNSGKNLIITRIFDAPRDQVWKTWSDPVEFKKWWGPKDFTCPVSKIDFRIGGKYLHCMRGPDNKNYWSTGTYREIVPMEKIVVTDSFADENGNIVPSTYYGMEGIPLELKVTVTFEEIEPTRTKMILKHVGMPEGKIKDQCYAGWNQCFDKFAKHLEDSKS